MAITGAIGAFTGASLTKTVSINFFLIVVGLIISYESFILLKDNTSFKRNDKKTNNKDNTNMDITEFSSNLKQKSIKKFYYNIFIQSIIGFLIGILGGLVGLVLGSIRLPAMIKILNVEPKIAVGTNMLISSVMGMFGFFGHLINNEINFLYLIVLGPSAMIGGFLGAKYTNHLSPSTLKKLIGIVLAIVGAVILISPIIDTNI
jgi:uncharacterized protein